MDIFDLKQFLTENKLTTNSRLLSEIKVNRPIIKIDKVVDEIKKLAPEVLEYFDTVSDIPDESGEVEGGVINQEEQSYSVDGSFTAFLVPPGGYPKIKGGDFKEDIASQTNDGEWQYNHIWWKRYPRGAYDLIFLI